MKATRLLAAAVVMGAAGQLAAETTADPAAGKALAEQYCSRCHDISPAGAFKTMPPSFASIAAFRTPDEIETRIWWPAMHSRMPQMSNLLTADEVAALTAYIVSLETK